MSTGDPRRRPADGRPAACGAAEGLCLAAAPAFAGMALLTATAGNGRPDVLCLTGQDALPLDGMTTMYLLMSVFHAAPWLRLLGLRLLARRMHPGLGRRQEIA